MAIDELIQEVKKRRPLWDLTHEDRSNFAIIDGLWHDVALHVGLSKEYVKIKWKSLRDSFVRETKVYKERCLTNPELKRKAPKWPHYKSMMFLIGHFRKDLEIYSNSKLRDTDESMLANCDKTALKSIDVIKLIEAVKSRPVLWDRNHENYDDHSISNVFWTETAEALGSSCMAVKKKWKGLRDNFRKELRKINASKMNKSHCIRSTAKYFSEMQFLRDHCLFDNEKASKIRAVKESRMIVPKVESENSMSSVFQDNDVPDSSYHESSNYEASNHDASNHEAPDPEITADPLLNAASSSIKGTPLLCELLQSFQKDLIELEKAKLGILNSAQDDDLLFFQSLLPFVKTLQMDRKFALRTRIQQMVCEYALNDCNKTITEDT